MKAGVSFHFTLKAKDQNGNMHRMGGAIKNVIVTGGGTKHFGYTRNGDSVRCEVEDMSDGVYAISGQLISAGTHEILVTDSHVRVSLLGTVHVQSNVPCGTKCKLSASNTYSAFVGTRHCISVELFDEFENRTHFTDECKVKMEAVVGDQSLTTRTAASAAKRGLTATPKRPQHVVFSFTPCKPQRAMLQVSINHTPLPECPVPFTVIVSKEDLRVKVTRLRNYLKGRHGFRYTPTLTVRREMLLESAVQALQERHFSSIMRIRFGKEPGVDTGGIVK